MSLGTATSNGFKTFDVRGTYMLSNLLQELALARDHGRSRIVLDEARLTENPVDRLSRMIRTSFWHALTRRIDGDGLEIICADVRLLQATCGFIHTTYVVPQPKNRSAHLNPRIYVPHGEPQMAEYYRCVHAGGVFTVPRGLTYLDISDRQVARDKPHLRLDVVVLPKVCDDETFVKSLNDKPGLLALAMEEVDDGKGGKTLKGIPFTVPGARFNEVNFPS